MRNGTHITLVAIFTTSSCECGVPVAQDAFTRAFQPETPRQTRRACAVAKHTTGMKFQDLCVSSALPIHSHCYPLSCGMPRWLPMEHGTTLHFRQLYSAEVLLSTGGTAMRKEALSAQSPMAEKNNCLNMIFAGGTPAYTSSRFQDRPLSPSRARPRRSGF